MNQQRKADVSSIVGRMLVPVLFWIGITTLFAAVMVSLGVSSQRALAFLLVASSIPYGVFIRVLCTARECVPKQPKTVVRRVTKQF